MVRTHQHSWAVGLWLTALCLAAGLGFSHALGTGRDDVQCPVPLLPSGLSVFAERRQFAPTLTLPGQVRSTRRHEVVSHYRYWMVVHWMADEGSVLAEGEPAAVVRNEVVESRIADRKRQVRRARVLTERARARSRMARFEDERAVRIAELALRRAESHLRALREGATEEEVRLAELALERRRLEFDATAAALARVRALPEGDVIAQETVRGLEHEHRLAQARLKGAQADLHALRLQPVEPDLLVAQRAVAVAKARLEAAKQAEAAAREQRAAELTQAERVVDVRRSDMERWVDAGRNETRPAPISGIVIWPPIYVGGKARPGVGPLWTATIAALVDPSAAAFVARATEEEVARLAIGQPAEVAVRCLPGRKLAGMVSAVGMTSEDLSATGRFARREERKETGLRVYDVVIELEAAEPMDFPHGMSGEGVVTVGEPLLATAIPRACVSKSEDEWWLLVRRGEGWEPRRIEVALEDGDRIAVAAGLAAGEEVAILAD